jgi:hypothetical protein
VLKNKTYLKKFASDVEDLSLGAKNGNVVGKK